MTRYRELKERARLVPGDSTIERRNATIVVRPVRLAFVININTPQEELIKYLAYNASVWGGMYNCLVPTDGQCLGNDWWNVLRRHDSDKVIFCGEKSPELVKRVEDTIQPFALWSWTDNVDKEHKLGLDLFGSVPLRFVLWHIYEEEKPIRQSNIRLPSHCKDPVFRLLIAAQLGTVDEALTSIYTEALYAEYVDVESDDLKGYLTALSDFANKISPLDVTKWNLSTRAESTSLMSGFNLVLCSETTVADVCIFWNLRMSPAMISKGTLLLPIDALRSQRNLRALANWCNESIRGTNHLTLVSATVNKRRLVRLRDRLKALLKEQFEVVNVWHANFSISQFQAYETESREEIVAENRVFAFKSPVPTFGERTRSGMEWVVDVDFRERARPGRGYIPPRYSKLNCLLAGERPETALQLRHGYRMRLAQGRIAFRVGRSTEYIRARLPKDEQLFTSLIRGKGYRCRTTDKCRYTRGIIGLLGQYRDADILRDVGLRELLHAMRNGEAYTFSEMKRSLRPGSNASQHQRIGELVADLALKKIFLRGYNIQCPACDLRRWYPIHDVVETMNCAGCLTRLQPPIEAPFHYKLNELVVRGVEQGVIPVLMTILVLSALGDESFLFLPGVEVEKDDRQVDIDLLAACNGNLILAECKDLREGCGPEAIKEIIEQFSATVQVALEMGAKIAFLSTLLDALPQALEQGLSHLRSQYKDIAIYVMLKSDLEQGCITKPMGRFLSPDDPDKETSVTLENLLPKRTAKKSGWIREPGQLRMTF